MWFIYTDSLVNIDILTERQMVQITYKAYVQ